MRRHWFSTSVASASHPASAHRPVSTAMRDQMSPHVREAIQAESKAQIANRVSVIFGLSAVFPVSYTHLTLPTNREV